MAKVNSKEKSKTMEAKKETKGKKAREEIKSLKIKRIGHDRQWDIFQTIAFWGLAVLLFLPPYFRGLFFAPDQERAIILASLVFWLTFLWRWLQKDHRLLSSPLDWFALALPVVYIISSFTAVNKGLAIDEVVKNILYFMTYWSVSRLVRNDEYIYKIMYVIYLSAIGVALAGLGTATGIQIKDGFLEGRIYSTFQYPNALAAYLGAVMFIGLYFWDRSRNTIKEVGFFPGKSLLDKICQGNLFGCLFAIGNYTLLSVFLGANSRGGLIVFSLVLIFYLIGLGAEKRLFLTLHMGLIGVISFVVINRFIPLALEKQGGTAWLWFFCGLAAVLAGQLAIMFIERYLSDRWKDDYKNYSKAFGGLVFLAVIVGGIWLLGHASILQKITNFSYLRTAFQRVNYIGTAAEMIKERPLIGWGGGGWQEAYQYFMDYYYISRQVHSYYFQVGVETGVLGLLVVAGIWVSFLYMLHRLYHDNKENQVLRQLTWTLTAIFLMISGHAAIDFDLSLSALTLVLWSCFGIVAGLCMRKPQSEASKAQRKFNAPNYVPIGLVTVVVMLLFIFVCCLIQSQSFMTQGIKMLQAQRGSEGIEYIEKALKLNPFQVEYHLTLAQVYSKAGNKDKAMEEAEKAVGLSKYEITPRSVLAQTAMASGNYSRAVDAVEDTFKLNPNNINVYENAASIYTQIGTMELAAGNRDSAMGYFQKSLQVPVRMDNYYKSVSEESRKLWTGPRLNRTPELKLYTGQASYWIGDFKTSEKNIQEAMAEEKIKSQALMYLVLIKEKQGNQKQAQELLGELRNTFPETIKAYEYFNKFLVL